MKGCHALCCLALAFPGSRPLIAQEPTEAQLQETQRRVEAGRRLRDAALDNLKAGKPLLALDWRRSATGDLEYRIRGGDDPTFVAWFGNGLAESLFAAGIVGWVMWFPHHGDVLSLTHGEHHLRRLGVDSTVAALDAFVRSPLPVAGRELALLDRQVAIDLLARRTGDAAAVAARTAIAADPKVDAALRERACGAKPKRARLDSKTVALPDRCDIVVVVDHDRMFDGLFLVDLGLFTGQLSTMSVLQMLKAPEARDAVLGQIESEFVTELPFEIVRRFGNARLDQTVFAWRAPNGNDQGGWTISSAGRFSPGEILAGLATAGLEGVRAERSGDAATVHVGGVELVVTETLATARTEGLPVKVDPDGNAWLVPLTDAVRVRVPNGSPLLGRAGGAGLQGVESYETGISFGESLTADELVRAKDAAAAEALAKQLQQSRLPEFVNTFAARFAPAMREATTRVVTVSGSEVRVRAVLPAERLPSLQDIREQLMKENLR